MSLLTILAAGSIAAAQTCPSGNLVPAGSIPAGGAQGVPRDVHPVLILEDGEGSAVSDDQVRLVLLPSQAPVAVTRTRRCFLQGGPTKKSCLVELKPGKPLTAGKRYALQVTDGVAPKTPLDTEPPAPPETGDVAAPETTDEEVPPPATVNTSFQARFTVGNQISTTPAAPTLQVTLGAASADPCHWPVAYSATAKVTLASAPANALSTVAIYHVDNGFSGTLPSLADHVVTAPASVQLVETSFITENTAGTGECFVAVHRSAAGQDSPVSSVVCLPEEAGCTASTTGRAHLGLFATLAALGLALLRRRRVSGDRG